MPGLTTEGLVVETFESLRDRIHGLVRNEFGPVPLDDSTIEGLFIDILVEAMIKLWEIGEVAYNAFDVDKALGAGLEALCILTGTVRRPPTFTIGTAILTGDTSTNVPAGKQASTGPSGTIVETISDSGAFAAATAWTSSTSYPAGSIRTNGGHIYYSLQSVPDTVAAPTHTTRANATSGPDPSFYWEWIGEGVAYKETAARATLTGPRQIIAHALTDIETPFVGWKGVGNLLDFSTGEDLMTDEDLKVLRQQQIAAPGTSTKNAISSALLSLDQIIQVTTFVNNTAATNADGMPPHSVEALVRGGVDQSIFDELLANVAAGIQTHGNTSGTSIDSEGSSHTMKFSRPTEKLIYVRIALIKDPGTYGGDTEVESQIVEYGDDQNTGRDVVPSNLAWAVHNVNGVLNVTDVAIYTDVIGTPTAWAPTTAYVATPGARSVVTNNGRTYICITSGTSAGSGGPTTTGVDITDGTAHWYWLGNTFAIAPRELAVHDTTRITVASTDGVP